MGDDISTSIRDGTSHGCAAQVDATTKPGDDIMSRSEGFVERHVSWIQHHWQSWSRVLLESGDEHGVQRIEPDVRQPQPQPTTGAILEFWFGCNCTTLNMTVGMLGPMKFSLSLREGILIGVAAATVGCIPVGFIASLGPKSGLRTMVINRFVMGWYVAKVMSVLVALMLMGFAILDTIAAGDTISPLVPSLPAASIVTVTISGVVALVFAVLGGKALDFLERWAWRPQLIALCVLVGAIVPRLHSAELDHATNVPSASLVRDRIGFFSIVFSSIITFSTVAADFFAHHPEETAPRRMIWGTFAGLWISYTLTITIGVSLASACSYTPLWQHAYERSPAALLVAAYEPLGGLGKVCCVVLAFSNSAAAAAGMFSQALAGQNVSTVASRLPRTLWTAVTGSVILVCAIAGRNSFAVCLQSFVSIVGSWASVWLTVFALHHLVVKKGKHQWHNWNRPVHMPRGIAATAAVLIGILVAMLSTVQPWFVGPISKLISSEGVELGTFAGPAAASLVFFPVRYVETLLQSGRIRLLKVGSQQIAVDGRTVQDMGC